MKNTKKQREKTQTRNFGINGVVDRNSLYISIGDKIVIIQPRDGHTWTAEEIDGHLKVAGFESEQSDPHYFYSFIVGGLILNWTVGEDDREALVSFSLADIWLRGRK